MDNREALRRKLRQKLGEKKITRGTRKTQEKIFEKSLKKMGLDKDRFKKDLEAVKKQGSISLDVKNPG